MQETLSTAYLLGTALVSVALLLFLIMYLKVHAFVSLVIVSLFTTIATKTPAEKILGVMLGGFGSTLASIALLVGLGAMIGKILEVSGGAQVLAETLINYFGEKKAPFALGLASLIFAFPIFFDAGLIVMLPVILSVAKRVGGSLLSYALPSVGAFSVMHVYLPPHPGPVAAGEMLGANVGTIVILGLIIAIPTWYISSYLFGIFMGKKINIEVPEYFQDSEIEKSQLPAFKTVISILLLPVILIFLNAIVTTLQKLKTISDTNQFFNFIALFGQTTIALLITLIVCLAIFYRQFGGKKLEQLCEKSLPAICSVVLVTGAGGMFGGVLRSSGIGGALANSLTDLGIPVIVAGFIIAACIRIAQGSATVALTTAAALIAPVVAENVDLSSFDKASIVLAVACGSVVCSHFNDSGFWLVKGLFNLDEKTTLKTWTVLETLIGAIGFIFVFIIYSIF